MHRLRFAALTASLCCVLAGPAAAQTPALLWAKSFTGGGLQDANALAQRTNKLWVGGSFITTINLGGAVHNSPLNAYIALFTTDGVYQWSAAFNLGGGSLLAAAVDSGDNVYIAGFFDGTTNFGGSALTTAGSYDIFLAKYNSAGVHQWSKKFGNTSLDMGLSLVVDNANNVVMGGRFMGSVDFGGGALVSAGSYDAFIAKFNSGGTHVWSQRFGDTLSQEVDGLGTSNGDVYAAGTFFGTVNLGGSALTSAGNSDIFLARFNSAGAHQWSQRYGDAATQTVIDVDADNQSVALIANVGGSINFGGSTLTGAGSTDIAIARFFVAGTHSWSKIYGDQDVQNAAAIDIAAGGIFVTGWFEGGINFGHPLSAGPSNSNIFVARLLSSDGSETWSQSFGFTGNSDFGGDIISSGSQAWCAGRFDKDVTFGYNGALFSQTRDSDAYVAQLGNFTVEPDIVAVEDVDNDQGGKVRLRWTTSDYDLVTSVLPIRNYEIYLRDDPLGLNAAGTAAAETWILAGEAPAHGLVNYYALAFTQQDATAANGMHPSVYKVRATTDDPALFFDSPALSGLSLDNLAPAVPLNLVLAGGELSWRAPDDDDVAYYTVYGSSGAFDASAQLLDYTTTPRMDVTERAFARFFVTATDRAGNESEAASLDGTHTVSPAAPRTLSVSAYPNPFNPATTIRYTLPGSGPVHVDVFSASGARVRTVVDAQSPAGAFTAGWDGRDDAGWRVASGIYFVRVEHSGATRAYKLVMLK